MRLLLPPHRRTWYAMGLFPGSWEEDAEKEYGMEKSVGFSICQFFKPGFPFYPFPASNAFFGGQNAVLLMIVFTRTPRLQLSPKSIPAGSAIECLQKSRSRKAENNHAGLHNRLLSVLPRDQRRAFLQTASDKTHPDSRD